MILDGRTLILVADGRNARLFEEARRAGTLTEHPEWGAGLASHDRTRHDSHGTGGRDKAEADFLTVLARRVQAVFDEHGFDELILIAAPRALGVLRRHLPASLMTRLVLSEPHDRVAAGLEDIQQAVRALRRINA